MTVGVQCEFQPYLQNEALLRRADSFGIRRVAYFGARRAPWCLQNLYIHIQALSIRMLGEA